MKSRNGKEEISKKGDSMKNTNKKLKKSNMEKLNSVKV